jgi:hypothetical protein
MGTDRPTNKPTDGRSKFLIEARRKGTSFDKQLYFHLFLLASITQTPIEITKMDFYPKMQQNPKLYIHVLHTYQGKWHQNMQHPGTKWHQNMKTRTGNRYQARSNFDVTSFRHQLISSSS